MIDIIISFSNDWDATQMWYQDYKDELNELINKETKSNDDIDRISQLETTIYDIEKDNSSCVHLEVKAKPLMQCGHYEEFRDSIGGLWFYGNRGYLRGFEDLKIDYKLEIEDCIQTVKDQVLAKLPNSEFNIIFEEDIIQ